jgi:myo-inositol catabolism protein IolC
MEQKEEAYYLVIDNKFTTMQTVDIKDLSIIELKAIAYDHIGQLETLQRNLSALTSEIQKREQAEAAGAKVIDIKEGADK